MKIFRQLTFTFLGFFLLTSSNTLAGVAQAPVIDEYFNDTDGEFVVHAGNSSIYAFAVANDTANASSSDTINWDSFIATPTEWNANEIFGFFPITGWTTLPDTSDSALDFQGLFGSASHAIVYWTRPDR